VIVNHIGHSRPTPARPVLAHTRHDGEVPVSNGLSDARFLTVAEVADMMRVSKMTVYRHVHSGDLPAIRFGRSFRVPESAVLAVLNNPVADAGEHSA
jgi:excisionase family DNA binding protein